MSSCLNALSYCNVIWLIRYLRYTEGVNLRKWPMSIFCKNLSLTLRFFVFCCYVLSLILSSVRWSLGRGLQGETKGVPVLWEEVWGLCKCESDSILFLILFIQTLTPIPQNSKKQSWFVVSGLDSNSFLCQLLLTTFSFVRTRKHKQIINQSCIKLCHIDTQSLESVLNSLSILCIFLVAWWKSAIIDAVQPTRLNQSYKNSRGSHPL